MRNATGSRRRSIALIIATAIVANATLLDDFWRLMQVKDLGVAGSDIATHYLRMLHARELYLPSGHRFGWDPFWFQGYVPFLLYPHLTYLLLAGISSILPLEPARLFNIYILAIYFALPLGAGIAVNRILGAAPAVVLTAWLSVLSTTGAGLGSVFGIGLLSQQVGVVLFAFLAIDIVLSRRLDRAAIWLGLIPLVHVHTSLIAGIAWLCAGGAALTASTHDRRRQVRDWIFGSAFAAGIALPTAVGLMHGLGNVGYGTVFPEMAGIYWRLLNGSLLVPQPALLGIALCMVATIFAVPSHARLRVFGWWCPLGLLLFALSMERWDVQSPVVDRVLDTMLYLRTLPFAFVWIAIVAICFWNRFPSAVRAFVVVLSLASIVVPRHQEGSASKNIGSKWGRSNSVAKSVTDYRAVLDWIANDVGANTTTLALAVPRPRAPWLVEAVVRINQPLLGGHGLELTSIRNQEIVSRTRGLSCPQIRRQAQDYAVGYVVGTEKAQREKLESCFPEAASFVAGTWWVVPTGKRWGNLAVGTIGFEHDRTWTTLEWRLSLSNRSVPMRLPMAFNPQWSADVDGLRVPIQSTDDGMMRVVLPVGSQRLRLEYFGYSGEWSTVVASMLALAAAISRARLNRQD